MDNQLQMWILNFNWFRVTMRFYNSLTRCNNPLLKKVLHADITYLISLSYRTDSCWTSHVLTALDGLAHLDLMRRQILACDPLNLNQFVDHKCGGPKN
eukprot:931061-Pelagomonas_calceolata.AAC.1